MRNHHIHPVEEEFDRLPLVSRQSDDGSVGVTSVKRRDIQQRYYAFIVEKVIINIFLVKEADRKSDHFDSVLAKLRKLREGITASGVYDDFAVQVYETSVDVCLLSRNFAELLKSLLQILNTIYPAVLGRESDIPDSLWCYACENDLPQSSFAPHELERVSAARELVRQRARSGEPLQSQPAPAEMKQYQTICTACSSSSTDARQELFPRRAEFTGYMLLYLICYTAPKPKCYGEIQEIMRAYKEIPPHLQTHQHISFAMQVLGALRADVDFVAFRRLRDQASWYEDLFLQCVWPSVQHRTYQILSKAYYTYPESALRLSLRLDDNVQFIDFMKRHIGEGVLLESRILNGTVHLRVPKVKARPVVATT